MFLYTKMRNVAGLSTSEAQKSSDMFGKCRYLDEITGGRGVIFATGTPISNSMTEMYTLMRYLQYNTLQQKGLTHFDAWASTFGETTTAIELAPEGTGYRARTRFAKFFNLPELMAMFKEAADIKTSDQLHLPVPDAKFETVVVKPSEIQQDMVQALSERAAEVHSGSVDPSVDNMLKITSDGRKIGLDQRLMNSALPDDPNSKLNACVNNVLRIWNDTKEQKLTQLIFCDMSTPKGDGSFNVYDDIRSKLLNAGVPEQEIEFIHNADTENKKAELFLFVQTHAPLIIPPWQSRARKSKFQFHIRRKGAEVFHPALAAGGPLMAYKCLSLCRFRGFTAGFCKNFVQRFQKFKMRFQGKAKNFDLFRMRKKFRVQVERNFPTLSHERFSIVEPVVQFEKLLGNIIVFINGVAGGFLCLLHRYFVRLDFLRLRHIILDFLKNFSLFFRLGLAEIFEKIIGNVQFLAEEPITETGRQFIRNVNAVGIVFCTAD